MKWPAEDGDDESESFSNFGQEPGFVPAQPQPFVPRDNNPRDHQREGQPYQPREQHQPREHSTASIVRSRSFSRSHRSR